ncbi:NAD(P)/FAD-dependent oxidoreductase [Sciscionella sediminilitoris]|uniref:NAD(P)/FAD-dependent oxidoreductase n=1 Tax=Sciscionella sediminilitoris TaxID=1445613 RepID=UPI0004DF0744|nr:FAD-dependent oxidoreductase [Sciscionella sp. SE31]
MHGEPLPESIVVVGAGLIGLCCAHYLRQQGFEVTVIERDRLGSGAARGNAGEICPGVAQPLAAPGMVSSAIAGMYRPDSALHIHPSPDAALIRFLSQFLVNATARRYRSGVAALAMLGADARRRFDELRAEGVDVEINKKGYLYVFGSESSAARVHELVRANGSAAAGPLLTGGALAEREPCLAEGARAGFEIAEEWTLDPSRFVSALVTVLEKSGVRFIEGARVNDIREVAGETVIHTSLGETRAGAAVLAAGARSPELSANAGVALNMFPGKGYSFSAEFSEPPSRLVKLEDARVAVTPMDGHVRIAGTMEFDRDHDRLNRARIAAIGKAAHPYLRGVDWSRIHSEWVGSRPMTPDGLPLIGRLPGHRNTYLATGHNMLGLALGPSTGALIAGLVTGQREQPPEFRPERFARKVRAGSAR